MLVSGAGTNLGALLEACADPSYGATVVAVGADRDGIEANFARGVLTLEIPKSANGHDRAKEIEIKVSEPRTSESDRTGDERANPGAYNEQH